MAKRTRARGTTRSVPPPPRRYTYTPELLARGRHRFEQTEDRVTDIALEFGVTQQTLRALAKREGWVRYRRPARDLSAADRLAAEAAALEEKMHAARAASQPSQKAAPDPAPAGGGEAAAPPSDEAAAAPPDEQLGDIDRIERGVRTEMAIYEAMRARLRNEPEPPGKNYETARTLASLAATLNLLQRMRAGRTEASPHDYDDNIPADLDAFRYELARRIDAFVASRTEPGDADGDAAGMVDAPYQ